jgi:hypothetical protein
MTPIEHLRELMSKARFAPLKSNAYFPTEIFEESPFGSSLAIQIRGWGMLQKQEDGAETQDARGKLVAHALNNLPALLAVVEAAQARSDFFRHKAEHLTEAELLAGEIDHDIAIEEALAKLTTPPKGQP